MNYWERIEIYIACMALVMCMIPYFMYLIILQMKLRTEILIKRSKPNVENKMMKIPTIFYKEVTDKLKAENPFNGIEE